MHALSNDRQSQPPQRLIGSAIAVSVSPCANKAVYGVNNCGDVGAIRSPAQKSPGHHRAYLCFIERGQTDIGVDRSRGQCQSAFVDGNRPHLCDPSLPVRLPIQIISR